MSGTSDTVNPPEVFNAAASARDAAVATDVADSDDAVTQDSLLDGRITYCQFRQGHRTGLEPVLMSALVPARRGQRVLEAGCGAGAGLLCLGARIPGLSGAGLEADGPTAVLARRNLDANGLGTWPVHHATIPGLATLRAEHNTFHHIFANPPWHRPHASTPDLPRRRLARTGTRDVLAIWVAALRPFLRPRGTLTLALPVALMDAAFAALRAEGFGSSILLPLWPKPGRAAKLCLIRAVSGGRGDAMLAAGLVLHDSHGKLTMDTEAILRDGFAISL